MALLFDGFNDYLRIEHNEVVFPNQVLFISLGSRQNCTSNLMHMFTVGVSKQCV
jgi:hypothetical protein